MIAIAILSLAVNALLGFTVCWQATHCRRPRPVKPHPVDVRRPRPPDPATSVMPAMYEPGRGVIEPSPLARRRDA